MSLLQSTTFLRRVLAVDAVSSGGLGLLLAAAAGPLSGLLALPEPVLRGAGLALLPFAAFVGWPAAQARPPSLAVWAVIGLNAVWAADSALSLVLGWLQPNGLGYAFIIGQAVFVAVLAELEFVGLRRAARAAVA